MPKCITMKIVLRSALAAAMLVGVLRADNYATRGGGAGEVQVIFAETAAATRIMPIGDSITQADGGHASYRYWLHKRLVAAGYSVDMVGSQDSPFRGAPRFTDFDPDHEGHWGWTTGEVAARMSEWAAAHPADIALIHLGTNDAFRRLSLDAAAANIAAIVASLRQANPRVRILLAQVIGTVSTVPDIAGFNARIPPLAAQLSTATSPVTVVDQNTGFVPTADTYDGVHPNESGERKLADRFFDGMLAGGALPAPGFSAHPASQTVAAGQPVSFSVATNGVPVPTHRWQSSSDGGSTWTDLSDVAPYSGTSSTTLTISTTRVSYPLLQFRAIAANTAGTATSNAATLTVPGLIVEPSSLTIRGLKPSPTGPVAYHSEQELLATLVALSSGPITWSANQPWVRLTPAPGGAPAVDVDVHDPGNALGSGTSASAVITASAPGVAAVQIPLTLHIVHGGPSSPPIGQVDSPAQGATGVRGAIVLSGWAIDDIGVSAVTIYRNCLAEEPQANCQVGVIPGREADRVVSLGEAEQVPGARPDIEAAFPQYPGSRAGWGLLILSNTLPRSTGTYSPFGGQGPLTLYAVASDAEGQRTLLGRSWLSDTAPTTLTLDNDAIAKPFGTIDTPAQGERVTADTLANFGWVLTPDSDTIQGNLDIAMPNVSGLTLFIDGRPLTSVTYNQCRGTVGNPVPPGVYCDDDVANSLGNLTVQAPLTQRTSNPTRFRNLDAGRGAIGAAVVTVSGLVNGLHTIAWSATDSAGRVEGIGARYFSVLRPQTTGVTDAAPIDAARDGLLTSRPTKGGVWARRGFDLSAPFTEVAPTENGIHRLRISELDRVELWLGESVSSAAIVSGPSLEQLPVGAHLDAATGQFTWMPGPGFRGVYRLAFQRGDGRVDVEVTIEPTSQVSPSTPEVQMGTPVVEGCETMAALECNVAGAITLAGRAADPRAFTGHGIGAVHVWALRRDQPAALPTFQGTAEIDVDGNYTFRTSSLERGVWDLTAYVWNIRTGRFEDARTVVVRVR